MLLEGYRFLWFFLIFSLLIRKVNGRSIVK